MRKLLLLMLLVVSSIGVWAQGPYYKFTSDAVDNLYTAADDASLASITAGSLCNQDYYIKSNYASTVAPSKVEAKAFNSKKYYILNDDVYTCVDGEAYDASKTYYKAEATQITNDNKNDYVGTGYTFNSSAVTGNVEYAEYGMQFWGEDWNTNGQKVKEGDKCILDTYYWANGDKRTGNELVEWGYVNSISTFNDPARIYTLSSNGIYTPINSPAYDSEKTYYAVTFQSSNVDESDVITSEVVTGLDADAEIYYYDSETATYKKVQNGDKYLGDNAYYKPESSFALRTPSELAALGYTRSVAGLVTTEPDGKTLNVICSGDVCSPDEDFATTGYKFLAKSNNVIFKDEEGTSVTEGSLYVEGKEYYTRTQKYAVQVIPTITKYQLTQSAYINNDGRYDVANVGTDINEIAYYANTNVGEATTATTTEVCKINETALGYVYILTQTYDWQGNPNGYNFDQYVVGKELSEDAIYAIMTTQWQNSTYNIASIDELKAGGYVNVSNIVNAEPVLYTIEGSSYIPAAGTVFDEGKTYYSGVTFAEIDNIKNNAEYATPVIAVNPGDTEYFIRSGEESNYTYTQVYSGNNYDESATYCVKDGFNYSPIELTALQSDNYVQYETVANNYWEALANEINANGYETVVFKTADGEPKATICEHVTRAMMLTNTVNALDYMDVQIESIESALIGGSAANPNGTFLYPSLAMVDKNYTVKILLLPVIKNAETIGGKEHRHVPSYCCTQFPNLDLIVMPDNATCIEEDAFSTGSGGFQLHTIVFNNVLERIESKAFNGNYELKNLTFPKTLKYIGQYAFNGGLNDVYFLGNKAPIVEKDAFGTEAYLNNNAIDDHNMVADWYRITRDNYVSDNYMAAMLHLPNNLTPEERAAYTDPTRDYHVFKYLPYEIKLDGKDTNVKNETCNDIETAKNKYPYANDYVIKDGESFVTLKYETIESSNEDNEHDAMVNGALKKVYYCSGNAEGTDFNATWGTGSGTGKNTIDAGGRVWNQWLSTGADWENDSDQNRYKNSGFYDKYAGMNYIWPSQSYMNRAFTVASNNKLWGGTKSIADGIAGSEAGATETTVTFDSNCDGTEDKTYQNGEEYMGLHEFILVTFDVSPSTNTQEWDFNTIGGKNWWTICVPVDMTVAEVQETFGENTQVCKFDRVERTVGERIKFFFTDEQCYNKDKNKTAIYANVPYMIHPSNKKGDGIEEGTSKFTLPQYTLSDQQLPVETLVEAVEIEKDEDNKDVKTGYKYKFIGQYNTNADGTHIKMPQYSYFLGKDGNTNNHKFYFQTGTTGTWKPFTCIIIPSDGKQDHIDFFGGEDDSNKAKVRAVSSAFGFEDFDEATSISNYEIICGSENAPSQKNGIYNLNGQFVGKSLDSLTRGIYIVNGNKYIVK